MKTIILEALQLWNETTSKPRSCYCRRVVIDLGLDTVNGVTTKHIQRKATALHGYNHNMASMQNDTS